MTWTEPRRELLKKLWSDGLSAGQIAAELGGVTRNAVIGCVHRMGLPGRSRKSPAPRGPKPVRKAPVRQRPAAATPVADGAPIEPAAPLAPLDHSWIPVGQRKSLVDLEFGDCRFPIGHPRDADFAFCAGPAVEGRPYCSAHCKLAFGGLPTRSRVSFIPRRHLS